MEKKKSKNSTDKDIKELKGKKKKQAKWKNSEKMDPTSTREDQKLHDFIGREAKRGRKMKTITVRKKNIYMNHYIINFGNHMAAIARTLESYMVVLSS